MRINRVRQCVLKQLLCTIKLAQVREDHPVTYIRVDRLGIGFAQLLGPGLDRFKNGLFRQIE